MAYNIKELAARPERFTGGHRMCAGCGAPVAVRAVLRALKPEDRAVVGVATGCLEVSSCIYPYTAWKDSFIHSAFENAAATVAGAEAAYKVLKKKEKSRASLSSSRLVATVEHTILVFSLFLVQWKEDTTWYMSAMTTVLI